MSRDAVNEASQDLYLRKTKPAEWEALQKARSEEREDPTVLGQLWNDVITRPIADFTKAASIGKQIQYMAGKRGKVVEEDDYPAWRAVQLNTLDKMAFPGGETPGTFERHESFTDPMNPAFQKVDEKLKTYFDSRVKGNTLTSFGLPPDSLNNILAQGGLPELPEQKPEAGNKVGTAIGGAVSGIENFVLGTIGFMTSPLGILTAGSGRVFELGSKAKAAASLGFAAMMGAHLPEQWQQFREALKRGDTDAATRIGTEGVLNLLATGAAGVHGLWEGIKSFKKSPPPAVPEPSTTPKTDAAISGPVAETRPERLIPRVANPVITPEPARGPPKTIGEIEQFLKDVTEKENIERRQTVPSPEKRASQAAPVVIGEQPTGGELILPERFMDNERRSDAIRQRLAEMEPEYDAARKADDGPALAKLDNEWLDLSRKLRDIDVERVRMQQGEYEGEYPPTAEQLGTFQSRATVPEISENRPTTSRPAQALEARAEAAVEKPSTPLSKQAEGMPPTEYPEKTGVVPPEANKAELPLQEFPPARPPKAGGVPESEQRSGLISGTDLERWADKVIATDPRLKTRGTFDPLDVKTVTAVAVKGAAMMERGIRNFAAWSAEMVKEFGEGIKPHLEDIFRRSANYYERKYNRRQELPTSASAWDNLGSATDENLRAMKAKVTGFIKAVGGDPEHPLFGNLKNYIDDLSRINNEINKRKGGDQNAISGKTTAVSGDVQKQSEQGAGALPRSGGPEQNAAPPNAEATGTPPSGTGTAGAEIGGETSGKTKTTQAEVLGESGAGPGGTTPADIGTASELQQLTRSLEGVTSQDIPWTEKLKRASGVAQTVDQVKSAVSQAVAGLKGAAAAVWGKLSKPPIFTDWTKAVGMWQGEDQATSFHARKFVKQIEKSIPDENRRVAIANWIEANGDEATLRQRAAETTPEFRQGYLDALDLTADEKVAARNVRNYFDAMLERAQQEGLFEGGVENYLHRMYEEDDPKVQSYLQELRGLRTNPALARKRFYEFDIDAEKAGKKPVKDFAKRLVAYDQSFNRAIAARSFVNAVRNITEKDGRPTVDVSGVGVPIDTEGVRDVTLVKPSAKPHSDDPADNRSDYVEFNHPAFRKWKWVATDEAGRPTLLEGNMLVHPDAVQRFKNLFERSWWRKGPIRRGAMALGSIVKQTKLSLSAFHPVQIFTHALEHKVLPFKNVDIDLEDPKQRKLVDTGLMISDPQALHDFSEGLSGSALTEKIPFIGQRLHSFNEWLFQDFIPRTKMTMALDALERNTKRFKDQLDSGQLTEDQLYRLTAEQANAAFGEQNYRMLGRNSTFQDALRTFLLAPDFLEARARFAGQALTKFGSEQRAALLMGGAALYTIARLVNKAVNGEWHWDKPFSVVVNGREYTLRTVQEDIYRAVTDPGRFAEHRLNPLYSRTIKEFLTGRNWRGEKRDFTGQAKDLADQLVPISIDAKDNDTFWTSMMNGLGLPSRMASEQTAVRQMADKYLKGIGREKDIEVIQSEDAPMRQLKVALRAGKQGDAVIALNELRKTRNDAAIFESMDRSRRMPFTGNVQLESKFKQSLTEAQMKEYQKAMDERQVEFEKFKELWHNRGPRQQ